MKEGDIVYAKNLFKSLLVSSSHSSKNSRIVMPTEREYLLGEMVSATLDYIGRPVNVGIAGFESEDKIPIFHRNLDCRLEWLRDSIHLDKDIGKTIHDMAISYQEDSSTDPYSTILYDILKNGFKQKVFQNPGQRISNVNYHIIREVRERTIPTFSDPQQEDIIGIGKCMRKYVDEDLRYLSEL